MTVSRAEADRIQVIEALAGKVLDVLDLEDCLGLDMSLNALTDIAASIIHEADDPESTRDRFVAALDQALEMLE